MKGLAYVDFSDDRHLDAALKKNKQIFMGKKVSILKSDPQQGKRKEGGRNVQPGHGKLMQQHCLSSKCCMLPCISWLLFPSKSSILISFRLV